MLLRCETFLPHLELKKKSPDFSLKKYLCNLVVQEVNEVITLSRRFCLLAKNDASILERIFPPSDEL